MGERGAELGIGNRAGISAGAGMNRHQSEDIGWSRNQSASERGYRSHYLYHTPWHNTLSYTGLLL
ncbi:hypothetical protein [Virgibacillus sediminis]|uniref:Uncharacterized protein n=1 Tax=Virgibacillus sediminis TaxID=202260 RepID=A0ABV7A994_9BACI